MRLCLWGVEGELRRKLLRLRSFRVKPFEGHGYLVLHLGHFGLIDQEVVAQTPNV